MSTDNILNVNEDQKKVLEMALEFYIRLGLGQLSEIATRLDLLQGKRLSPEKMTKIRELCSEIEDVLWEDEEPWNLTDSESLYTLNAFLLECKLTGDTKRAKWAEKRIKKIEAKTQEKI